LLQKFKKKLYESDRLSSRTCVISGRNLLSLTDPGVSSSSNCTENNTVNQYKLYESHCKYNIHQTFFAESVTNA